MTDAPPEASQDAALLDDLATFAIEVDGGPDELDIPDEPAGPNIDSDVRDEDGPQDVNQDPEPAE
jgi:hypothetical protein